MMDLDKNLDRTRFFYEYPVKMQMVHCNKYYQNGENGKLIRSMGMIFGFLPFGSMIYVMDEVMAIKEADFFERYDKAPEIYVSLKEKMNQLGLTWIEETECNLTIAGLEVWSE